jgi:hypothetical protein
MLTECVILEFNAIHATCYRLLDRVSSPTRNLISTYAKLASKRRDVRTMITLEWSDRYSIVAIFRQFLNAAMWEHVHRLPLAAAVDHYSPREEHMVVMAPLRASQFAVPGV